MSPGGKYPAAFTHLQSAAKESMTLTRLSALISMLVPCVVAPGHLACCHTPADTCEAPSAKSLHVDFQNAPVGTLPNPFTAALTPALNGAGAAPTWVVIDRSNPANDRNHVLAQTSTDPTEKRFPLCIYNALSTTDVTISTMFKPVAGKVDQAGGVIVRYQEPGNYYVARANALEDNVRLYKVQAGVRTQFGAFDTRVTTGQWHDLTLSVRGTHFLVTFDGKAVIAADDATFTGPGCCGLWTKADSVTYFDQIRIQPYHVTQR